MRPPAQAQADVPAALEAIQKGFDTAEKKLVRVVDSIVTVRPAEQVQWIEVDGCPPGTCAVGRGSVTREGRWPTVNRPKPDQLHLLTRTCLGNCNFADPPLPHPEASGSTRPQPPDDPTWPSQFSIDMASIVPRWDTLAGPCMRHQSVCNSQDLPSTTCNYIALRRARAQARRTLLAGGEDSGEDAPAAKKGKT